MKEYYTVNTNVQRTLNSNQRPAEFPPSNTRYSSIRVWGLQGYSRDRLDHFYSTNVLKYIVQSFEWKSNRNRQFTVAAGIVEAFTILARNLYS